jgi:hypothetical protein
VELSGAVTRFTEFVETTRSVPPTRATDRRGADVDPGIAGEIDEPVAVHTETPRGNAARRLEPAR